jgi:hypothetical protein
MLTSRKKLLSLCAVLAAATLGCARRAEPFMGERIDGVRFSAHARLVGARRDTIVVRIRARNASREARKLTWYAGGDEMTLRVAPLRGGFEQRVRWDSGERQRVADEARARRDTLEAREWARRDTTGARLREVIIATNAPAIMVRRTVSPGDSAVVATMVIPVRAILGDSLRPGWYRLTVRGNGNVWSAGPLRAADLELRLPRG